MNLKFIYDQICMITVEQRIGYTREESQWSNTWIIGRELCEPCDNILRLMN